MPANTIIRILLYKEQATAVGTSLILIFISYSQDSPENMLKSKV
jgi:hypothetical protein